MSALEPLAPDQRAVVALVLQQGRSYDEIAALLGMPVDAVRARARAGLASLAHDNGLPGEVTGPLADYLLGQQPPADAEATRGLLAESPPARAWATGVSAQLQDVAPQGLPEIPAPAGRGAPSSRAPRPRARTAPAPGPRGPRRPRATTPLAAASRLGGALLIAGVLAVVALVLFLVLRGGDDPAGEQAAAPPPATPGGPATPAPTADRRRSADTIALRSPGGGDAKGTMTVFLQDGQLLFALEAQDVPPSSDGRRTRSGSPAPGDRARRLGFTNPVGDGRPARDPGPGRERHRQVPEALRHLRARRRVEGDDRGREAPGPRRPHRQAAPGPLAGQQLRRDS